MCGTADCVFLHSAVTGRRQARSPGQPVSSAGEVWWVGQELLTGLHAHVALGSLEAVGGGGKDCPKSSSSEGTERRGGAGAGLKEGRGRGRLGQPPSHVFVTCYLPE